MYANRWKLIERTQPMQQKPMIKDAYDIDQTYRLLIDEIQPILIKTCLVDRHLELIEIN